MEFVGDVLAGGGGLTGVCSRPRIFGDAACTDGAKVLCDTDELGSGSCVVYSFGVGFDTSFERALLAQVHRTFLFLFFFLPPLATSLAACSCPPLLRLALTRAWYHFENADAVQGFLV